MKPHTITTELAQDADGTWLYVHVPATVRADYAGIARRGIIHVTATVGATSWTASLLPWADGSAQLSINRRVREREGLRAGQPVTVRLEPRAD